MIEVFLSTTHFGLQRASTLGRTKAMEKTEILNACKDKVKNDEVNPDEPNLAVLQFYLREVEGIFTDQPDYETGEQKYHAVVEIGDQVRTKMVSN